MIADYKSHGYDARFVCLLRQPCFTVTQFRFTIRASLPTDETHFQNYFACSCSLSSFLAVQRIQSFPATITPAANRASVR